MKKSNNIIGIEIRLYSNSYSIRYILLESNKGQLNIKESHCFDTIQDLLLHTGIKTPFYLSITGEGMLIKTTHNSSSKVESELFPGLNSDDIYLSNFEIEDNRVSALIKRKRVDQLLSEFSQVKVLGVFISPLLVFNLEDYLEFKKDIYYDGYSFNSNNNEFSLNFSSQYEGDKVIKIDPEVFEERYLIAYSTALEYYAVQQKEANTLDKIDQLYNSGTESKNRLIAILCSVFVLLLCNFIVFNYVNKKNQNIIEELNYKKALLIKNDSLNLANKNKEKIITSFNKTLGNPMDYYLDRIAASLPDNITWTMLNCFPIENKIEKESITTFKENTILIEGTCDNAITLNQWIVNLKKYTWIKSVEIDKFVKQDNINPVFAISISLNNEVEL